MGITQNAGSDARGVDRPNAGLPIGVEVPIKPLLYKYFRPLPRRRSRVPRDADLYEGAVGQPCLLPLRAAQRRAARHHICRAIARAARRRRGGDGDHLLHARHRRLLVSSVGSYDYAIILALTLLILVVVAVANLAADLLYARVNPQVRV